MDFLAAVEGRVTGDMRMELERDFVEEEITRALYQMHSNKALGPDGMSPMFFQKFWRTIGPPVTAAFLRALDSS